MTLGKRKTYFIKKDFQSRFILRFVSIATFWTVSTALLFAYLAGKKLDDLRYSSHFDIASMSELFLPLTIGVHAASLLIFIGILAYAMQTLQQRLSSSLTALRKYVAIIAEGDLRGKVVLRKDDEFQDLAANLDGMREDIRDRLIRIKECQQDLSTATTAMRRSVLEGNAPADTAAPLKTALERMKNELKTFHF